MSVMPEAVVFDLGKVLVDFDYSIAARRIAACARVSAGEIQHLIDHTPLLFRYETGSLNRQQFFAETVAATGFDGTLQEFCEFFADIFTPIPPMVELQGRLRARGVPTYIFSNTNDLAIAHIRKSFPFFGQFDGYVLSYEQGAMKPEARIYEAVERLTGRQGARLLYLDDRLENIEGGQDRGWQVIHHRDAAATLTALRAIGLPV